jgi:hypothetical protein
MQLLSFFYVSHINHLNLCLPILSDVPEGTIRVCPLTDDVLYYTDLSKTF